jgi:glycosyltransferase involved in cell wall biosynthesis
VAAEIAGLRLRLVGRCETGLAADLRARVHRRGHPDLLELTGYVPHAQLPQELCRAHVFAAPSFYEGGPGLVYLEAMACGLPVIACGGSGAAEVVSDGATGRLIQPDDPDILAGALRTLLEDRALREQMGEVAQAYAVREADSQVCMQRLEQFYRAAASRP